MPKPNRGVGPNMPRSIGMGAGPGHFGSPSKNPNIFKSNVQGALSNLAGQMSGFTPYAGGFGGGLGGKQGGGKGGKKQPKPPVPGVVPGRQQQFGQESLNTYAPPINPQQFVAPDYEKIGMKKSKLKGGMGGLGGGMDMGSMFGMMGSGGNPFSSGGMMPGGMDFMSMIFPMLMQQMMGGQGPQMGG